MQYSVTFQALKFSVVYTQVLVNNGIYVYTCIYIHSGISYATHCLPAFLPCGGALGIYIEVARGRDLGGCGLVEVGML